MTTITLSNIHEFSEQEIFDYVYEYSKKGIKSGEYNRAKCRFDCKYRSKDGEGNTTACFVGYLISDEEKQKLEEYNSGSIEGRGVCPIVSFGLECHIIDSSVAMFKKNLTQDELEELPLVKLLYRLQGIHDEYNPEDWHNRFVMVARELRLTPPQV